MTDTLKPCPLCGSENLDTIKYTGGVDAMDVQCMDCGCIAASAAWNRRAVPEEVVEADKRIGFWLCGALEDPKVCDKMKADINNWFARSCSWPEGVKELE